MHQPNSDASCPGEYEEDADGPDEAAKAAILEVFAGGDTMESHAPPPLGCHLGGT